jgi:type IV pilus assembly protein PilP
MRRLHLVHLVALLSAALTTGCGAQSKAPAHPAAPAKPPPAAPATAAEPKAEAPVQEWAYSSAGKRDPFRSFLADVDSVAARAVMTTCATPLGRFELEQLKLVAVVTGLDDPVAMVEAPNGVGYNLKRGTCVGRNGGVVAVVRSGEVVVSEWAIRADGTRDRTRSILRLPKEASLNLEE